VAFGADELESAISSVIFEIIEREKSVSSAASQVSTSCFQISSCRWRTWGLIYMVSGTRETTFPSVYPLGERVVSGTRDHINGAWVPLLVGKNYPSFSLWILHLPEFKTDAVSDSKIARGKGLLRWGDRGRHFTSIVLETLMKYWTARWSCVCR